MVMKDKILIIAAFFATMTAVVVLYFFAYNLLFPSSPPNINKGLTNVIHERMAERLQDYIQPKQGGVVVDIDEPHINSEPIDVITSLRPSFSRPNALVQPISQDVGGGRSITKYAIDWSVGYAEFPVSWMTDGLNFDMELIQPDGKVINQQNYSQNSNVVERVKSDHYEFYRLYEPLVGEWTVQVTGPVDREAPFVDLLVGTNLVLEFSFDAELTKQTYRVGDAMNFLAMVSQAGAPVIDAQVELEVKAYNSFRDKGNINQEEERGSSPGAQTNITPQPIEVEVTNLTLLDDGQHGDNNANDGYYGATFDKTTAFPGSYCFDMRAKGLNQQAEQFYRHDMRCTVVVPN
ncbi:MAG: choice-of-anchor X domain-containing protein [Patescibacteria group bacterium]